MRLSQRPRAGRVLALIAVMAAVLAPATAVRAADPLILKAGTTQTLQTLNPWNVVEVIDFEVMTLNYDTLVGFGPNNEPVPGFAESWTRSADGLTWTFKIRDGMKWSDGTPATSEDARWTMQYVLDATNHKPDPITLGLGYLEPYQTSAGVTAVAAPDPTTLVVTSNLNNPLLLQSYVPILPKHIWSKLDPKTRRPPSRTRPRSSGPAPTRSSSTSPATSSGSPATRTTGAPRAPRTRSSSRRSRTTTR